jgi:DNA-directed RNA polymerase specialized sigma24 family protein
MTEDPPHRPSALPPGYALEGKGANKRAVPVVPAPDHCFDEKQDDEALDPPVDDLALELAARLLKGAEKQIYALLRDGPRAKMPERAVGIFKVLEIEDRGLREIAAELGVSTGNLSQECAAIRRKMNAFFSSKKQAKSLE